MSVKPETQFIASVHNHLKAFKLHSEKMHNPYRGGTWDMWYSGTHADLWVEYKFIHIPALSDTPILPELSELQLKWGRGRYAEGRNLAVIVGCKEGGVIYTNMTWVVEMSTKEFRSQLKDRKALSEWIRHRTGG